MTISAHTGGRWPAVQAVRIGDYLHSARDLYRVEVVTGERALVEDCRNGALFDVPLSELLRMKPVRQNGASR